MKLSEADAIILRGRMRCKPCGREIAEGAARAILYLSPQNYAVACLDCSQKEAGLNHELVKVPRAALVFDGRSR